MKNTGRTAFIASILLVGLLLFGCASVSNLNYTSSAQNYTQQSQDNIQNTTNATNYTSDKTKNESKPEVTFNVTGCTATVHDFGSGSEDWAAGLNCSFVTNRVCVNLYRDSIIINISGPDGKQIGNEYSVCGNGSKMIRMASSWTTPDIGTYKLMYKFYSDGTPLGEKSITFSGQKVAVIPILTIPGSLVESVAKGEYNCYDKELNYVGFKLNNSGDLPVFADRISATIDGKNADVSPNVIRLAPGTTTGTRSLCWSPALKSGMHTLIVNSYNEGNKLSEDMINFYIPSLETAK